VNTYLARRVEVDDILEPTLVNGPITVPGRNPGEFLIFALEVEDCFASGTPFCSSIFQYGSNTVFGVSGQFSNLQSLPFAASFASSSLFPGQNVSVFTPGTLANYENVTTLTLMPQTVNGTVTAVSTNNSFTVYNVALASYDLIPTLQGFVGPVTRLNNPNIVTVYVSTETHLLNSTPISPGSVLRFRGLLFDDNGTLRMDCAQINDGVSE
jgi:hypothetical protein